MSFYKNVANQIIAVFAQELDANSVWQPKTGDANNITAKISLDGVAGVATNDINPSEISSANNPGWYAFTMTAAESNCNCLVLSSASNTANVNVGPVQIYPSTMTPSQVASIDQLDADVTDMVANGVIVKTLNANVVTAAALALDAINELVETLYKYDMANIIGEANRSLINAVRPLRNRVVVEANGVITVYKEDDTTPAWTSQGTANANAAPLVEWNPD